MMSRELREKIWTAIDNKLKTKIIQKAQELQVTILRGNETTMGGYDSKKKIEEASYGMTYIINNTKLIWRQK